MKKIIDKSFVFTLIVLAAVAIIIGMFAGPLGDEEISIGMSMSACIFSVLIIFFGLYTWPTIKKKYNKK